MNRRVVTLVPVLLGGAAGALFGLLEAFPKATPETAQASSPAAPRSPAVSAEAPSVAAALAVPLPSSSAAPGTAPAAASASAAKIDAAPSASAAPPKRAFDLAEPTTPESLLAAQVQCNRGSPEDCERAASGLESGSLGAKDPPRARSLRRIALTLYVKQCETGRAIACARLAEMYDVGDIVQANPRNAQALRTRKSELCAQHPSDSGCLP